MNSLGNTLLILGNIWPYFGLLFCIWNRQNMQKKILLSAKLLAKPLVKIQFRADISHEISALFVTFVLASKPR